MNSKKHFAVVQPLVLIALFFVSATTILASLSTDYTASSFSQFCSQNTSICTKQDFQDAREGTVYCPNETQEISTVYVHAGDGQSVWELPDDKFSYVYSNNNSSVTVTALNGTHDISWIGVVCQDPQDPTETPTPDVSITISPSVSPSVSPTDSPTPTPTTHQECEAEVCIIVDCEDDAECEVVIGDTPTPTPTETVTPTSTPTPTDKPVGGDGGSDGKSDGKSDGGSSGSGGSVGGASASTGSVLGASTLADTGIFSTISFASLLFIAAGLFLTSFSAYEIKKSL